MLLAKSEPRVRHAFHYSKLNPENHMLTLDELQSCLQIEYELHLEALGEEGLRPLLADPAALGALIPAHLSDAEGRRIAEATLAELIARKRSDAERSEHPLPLEPPIAWAQLFKPFWMPFLLVAWTEGALAKE
jgi:hypothetical protein